MSPADEPLPPSPAPYAERERGEGRDHAKGLSWAGAAAAPSGAGAPADPDAPPDSEGFGRNTVFLGIGLALATFVVLQVIAVGILLAIDEDPSDRAEKLAGLIVTLALDAVALVVIPVRLVGGRARAMRLLGLKWPDGKAVGWSFAGLAIAYIALGAYVGLVELLGIEDLEPISTIDDDVIYEHLELVILTGVLAVLVAPVAEEIFFRGFLIGGFARRVAIVPALILSAALFAAVHLDVGSLIPFALIGLVFGWLFIRSGSLAAPMLAHFFFNLIAFTATIVDRGVG